MTSPAELSTFVASTRTKSDDAAGALLVFADLKSSTSTVGQDVRARWLNVRNRVVTEPPHSTGVGDVGDTTTRPVLEGMGLGEAVVGSGVGTPVG